MAVTSNITSQTASASAAIQFRPQDVGTTASVYTFAVAPRSQVKAAVMGEPPHVVGKALSLADNKDTTTDCVLAQLSSSGQLIAVTSAQLQAYSSGALSASGASVTLLNNASTPAVAGATFYVGYGAQQLGHAHQRHLPQCGHRAGCLASARCSLRKPRSSGTRPSRAGA